MENVTALLQQLGFSEYEARAYITLLRENPLNGYELAKASGIPRPNIYAVLQKLEERQAVTPLETGSGLRYVPLPPDVLVSRMNQRYDHLLTQVQHSLATLPGSEADVIWNLRGYDAVVQQAQVLIDSAQTSLVLGVWQPEAAALAGATDTAQARGVEMTTLCLQACPVECGNCRDRVYRYHAAPPSGQRWLVVVRDDQEMVFAGIDHDEASAMHTRQPNFVQMTAWYIRHSIALAAILTDLDSTLFPALSLETQATLQALAPSGQAGWLDYMLALVKNERP